MILEIQDELTFTKHKLRDFLADIIHKIREFIRISNVRASFYAFSQLCFLVWEGVKMILLLIIVKKNISELINYKHPFRIGLYYLKLAAP